MKTWTTFDLAAIEPEDSAPLPERLLAGNPRFTTWSVEERDDSLYSGVWEATPGKWKVVYEEWEYFHIHAGHSVLTEEGGEAVHLTPGSSMIVRPGFTGTWEVLETTRKDYVIRL